MSRAPILIKDLVRGNQVWKMMIRVVDLWVVVEKNGHQHLEMVIQDVKGDKIHVTTWNRDFKDWFEQVKEHETFIVYNGEPIDNEGPLKVCSHPLKLIFNGGTTMTKVALPDIPAHKYIFHPIDNFLKGNYKHDLLYDVIGVLQDVVRTQMGGGNRKSCVNITLRDVEGNVIELALWEAYGKQFMNYTTPDNITTAPILNPNQLTQTSEQSICAEPYSAANPTWSPEESSNSTPAKRVSDSASFNDLIQPEEITPKQSATKAKTGKKIKHLKKE